MANWPCFRNFFAQVRDYESTVHLLNRQYLYKRLSFGALYETNIDLSPKVKVAMTLNPSDNHNRTVKGMNSNTNMYPIDWGWAEKWRLNIHIYLQSSEGSINKKRKNKKKRWLRLVRLLNTCRRSYMPEELCYNGNENDETHPALFFGLCGWPWSMISTVFDSCHI
jgi:hypothetical protein